MESISATEKKIVEEIINLGYQHASTSFSMLTGQNVKAGNTICGICTDENYRMKHVDHLKDLTVVQTDIIGQLNGTSYLIFNDKEKKAVTGMSLDAFGGPTCVGETAILKEIDNIVAAAVITELANALNVNIYGDVPRLYEVSNIEESPGLMNKAPDHDYVMACASFFFDGHQDIAPIFIWKIEKKIVSLIAP